MNTISLMGKSCGDRIRLGASEVAAMPGRRGTAIRCVKGLLWVTQEGDARDYLVPCGLCFVAAGAGHIVINGMAGDNAVEIGDADAAGTNTVAYQPLQIDWERFARIESAARDARAAYLAAVLCAALAWAGHAWRRVLGRRAGATSTAAVRPSRGHA